MVCVTFEEVAAVELGCDPGVTTASWLRASQLHPDAVASASDASREHALQDRVLFLWAGIDFPLMVRAVLRLRGGWPGKLLGTSATLDTLDRWLRLGPGFEFTHFGVRDSPHGAKLDDLLNVNVCQSSGMSVHNVSAEAVRACEEGVACYAHVAFALPASQFDPFVSVKDD